MVQASIAGATNGRRRSCKPPPASGGAASGRHRSFERPPPVLRTTTAGAASERRFDAAMASSPATGVAHGRRSFCKAMGAGVGMPMLPAGSGWGSRPSFADGRGSRPISAGVRWFVCELCRRGRWGFFLSPSVSLAACGDEKRRCVGEETSRTKIVGLIRSHRMAARAGGSGEFIPRRTPSSSQRERTRQHFRRHQHRPTHRPAPICARRPCNVACHPTQPKSPPPSVR